MFHVINAGLLKISCSTRATPLAKLITPLKMTNSVMSSLTRLETVVLFGPVISASLAHERGEVSLRQFRMTERFISLTRA
jgi:hypothetical protein